MCARVRASRSQGQLGQCFTADFCLPHLLRRSIFVPERIISYYWSSSEDPMTALQVVRDAVFFAPTHPGLAVFWQRDNQRPMGVKVAGSDYTEPEAHLVLFLARQYQLREPASGLISAHHILEETSD